MKLILRRKIHLQLNQLFCVCLLIAGYRRVCYVSNWAQYRPSPGTFFPSQTDPTLCTHIMFAFAVLGTDNKIKPYEWNDDIPGGLYVLVLTLNLRYQSLSG